MDNGVKLIKTFEDGRRQLFTGSQVSQQEIPVKLMYIQNDKAELELVWNVEVRLLVFQLEKQNQQNNTSPNTAQDGPPLG